MIKSSHILPLFISFVLLFKEVVLLFFRSIKLKKNIKSLAGIYLNTLFVILIMIISIKYDQFFYLSLIFFIIFNLIIFLKKVNK